MDLLAQSFYYESGDSESSITSNDLVLENILNHMSMKDLLNCSLINQRWLLLSRKEMRRRECKIWIQGRNAPPCHELRELSSFLESIPAERIPFNGLRIDSIFHDKQECIEDSNNPAQTFSGIVAKCPLKYVEVELYPLMVHCPTMSITKLLLRTRANEIESLCIQCHMESSEPGLTQYLDISNDPFAWFPNLRVLSIPSGDEATSMKIPNGAPNLKEIRGFIRPRHFPFLLTADKVHLVRQCRVWPEWDTSPETFLKFARLQPKLESIQLYSDFTEALVGYPEWLTEGMAFIMEGSADSLRELDISNVDLLLLSTLEVPPLRNLKKLKLNLLPIREGILGCLSLRSVNWPNLFPALESVAIYFGTYPWTLNSLDTLPTGFQRSLDRLPRPGTYCSPSVRSIELTVSLMGRATFACIHQEKS